MTRVRTDNVFGVTTDNPLTSGATTMNSAGLANLAVVSSTEALIVLDPNRVSGAPEIVVVTAHTGSATSATIERGAFGTTAREHAAGTEWVHGPIASNATSYASAANLQGDFVPMGAWESWTPTLTNITQGSGTVTARFVRVGRFIEFYFRFVFGSGSAVGTDPQFTLPAAPSSIYDQAGVDTLGVATIRDSGSATFGGVCLWLSGSTAIFRYWNAAGTALTALQITASAPMTWATSDVLLATGRYQAAS